MIDGAMGYFDSSHMQLMSESVNDHNRLCRETLSCMPAFFISIWFSDVVKVIHVIDS